MSGDIYRTLLIYTTGDVGNYPQYSNPEFDAIVEEMASATGDEEIRALERAGHGDLADRSAGSAAVAVLQPHRQQWALLDQLALHRDRSVHERHPDAYGFPLHDAAVKGY